MKEIYLDANVIIDLIALECLTEVLEIPSALFRATENVLKEIIDPEERELVESVISRDLLQRVALTEVELLRDYAQLKRILGDGEAATLAVTSSSGATMASDEKGRLRKEALKRLGDERLCGTPELLANAIAGGRLRAQDLEERVHVLAEIAHASAATHREMHFTRILDEVRARRGRQDLASGSQAYRPPKGR